MDGWILDMFLRKSGQRLASMRVCEKKRSQGWQQGIWFEHLKGGSCHLLRWRTLKEEQVVYVGWECGRRKGCSFILDSYPPSKPDRSDSSPVGICPMTIAITRILDSGLLSKHAPYKEQCPHRTPSWSGLFLLIVLLTYTTENVGGLRCLFFFSYSCFPFMPVFSHAGTDCSLITK